MSLPRVLPSYALLFVIIALLGLGPVVQGAPRAYRTEIEPHWFEQNKKFWYRLNVGPERYEFFLVDATAGKRKPAFDHERLAKALAEPLGKEVAPDKLPFNSIKFVEDDKLEFNSDGKKWTCHLTTYELTSVAAERNAAAEAEPENARGSRGAGRGRGRVRPPVSTKSPNGKWEVTVRGHNLYLRDLKVTNEFQLTHDANPSSSYARDVERDRAVEMEYEAPEPTAPTPQVYWSPDSRRLVAMRNAPGTRRIVYLIESSPKDQLQPKLQSYPYLKPGDDVPNRTPHLFDVEARKEIPVETALFSNPWSIESVRWASDSSRFTFQYNQRGHQMLRVLGVDAKSGDVKTLIDETSETFIDYSGKAYSDYADDGGEIIWASERDGWNHLYLYDARKGTTKNQITKGEWVIRGVERVDHSKRQVWFRAAGVRPGQDPYYIHIGRVNFDGSDLKILTEGNGTHTVQFSPDRRFLIDTWSRVDLAPVHELRQADTGELVCKLEEGDMTQLGRKWRPPEQFVAKGRDGETDIYGVIHWPANVDPKKTYPVIESIYAGPHGSFVPRSFRAAYGQEELTKLGFVVVQIDGMGTSHRSKKFHDVCWKNLGDAGFPDRILWMKAAAKKYPHLDLNRVGIYGGSAGGQNALRALLAHGDFYKAAAADCGCHDNRMDKIWWNEQWMGWPVGPHYETESNVALAHKLQGKLLLTVGELDRNVDPASTMQVVDALIKADKDFDLIVFPGAGHGAGGSPYGRRRRNEFFARHLLNQPVTSKVEDVTAAAGGR
jgi:dipeptidyl aminopeptidase/acylaminoacyl peptidase